jgi:hypothetical protein
MTGAQLQFVAEVLDVLADITESASRDWIDREERDDEGRYFYELAPRRSRRTERRFKDGVDDLTDRIDRATEELRRRRT